MLPIRSSAALLGIAWILGCLEPPITPVADETTTTGTTTGTTTTSADTTSGTTGGPAQTPACADYLACLGEIAPDEVPSAEAEIGPDGSCWQSPATASACNGECTVQLAQRCAGGSSSETGDVPLKCSIEGLLPGAPNPIDAGDGVAQLPLSIGDVLERNCGCHYLDAADLDRTVPAYNGTIALATWTDFHAPFMGTPTYQRVRQRAVVELSMPPSFFCDALAFGSLSAEDHALLDAWLAADAPDGASWP